MTAMQPPQNVMLQANFDRCTGCELCLMACSFRWFGAYNPRRAMLRIEPRSEHLYHFPITCRQCENAYCATACPVDAIRRDPDSGAMVVDPDTCVGCNQCHIWCPVSMAGVDPDSGKSVKCDLCGGNPECAAACPTGALQLVTLVSAPEREENDV